MFQTFLPDTGCKLNSISFLGMTLYHPSVMLLTRKQTCWNTSWWRLCHCLKQLQMVVLRLLLLAVLWSSLVRVELKHTPEMDVQHPVTLWKSLSSSKDSCPTSLLGLELSASWWEWNLSCAIESLCGNHMSKGSKVNGERANHCLLVKLTCFSYNIRTALCLPYLYIPQRRDQSDNSPHYSTNFKCFLL